MTGGRKEGEEEERRRDEEQRAGGKAGESRQDLRGLQGCVEQMPNILTLPWPNVVPLSGVRIQLRIRNTLSFFPNREMCLYLICCLTLSSSESIVPGSLGIKMSCMIKGINECNSVCDA